MDGLREKRIRSSTLWGPKEDAFANGCAEERAWSNADGSSSHSLPRTAVNCRLRDFKISLLLTHTRVALDIRDFQIAGADIAVFD